MPKVLFALHSHYTGDTPYRVWFNLNNFLTQWKWIFFKIPYYRNTKSSVWNKYETISFFTRQAIEKITFVLHSTYAGDTSYQGWLDLDNSLTRSKRPIFKIRYSRKSKYYVWKFNFFPRQAIAKTLFLLYSIYREDTLYQVWFNLDNFLTQWKRTF